MVSGTDIRRNCSSRLFRSMGRFFVIAAIVVGCTTGAADHDPAPGSSGPFYPYLGATNGTAVEFAVRVNGGSLSPLPAGGDLQLPVPSLPAPPWHVELLSPSHRVLLAIDVPASDVWRPMPTGEGQEVRGDAAFVYLSCGRVDLYYGPPALGPAVQSPTGSPGDCD